jgi:uncharacterized protein (DUF1800 family)
MLMAGINHGTDRKNRREFFSETLVSGDGLSNMLPKAESSWTLEEAAHLMNRAGFGGTPAEINRIHSLGRKAVVDALLSAEDPADSFPKPDWADEETALANMREMMEQRREKRKAKSNLSPEEAEKQRRETFKMIQQENRRNSLEAQGDWFRRMLLTRAPLREKMTLFWHDHFATSVQKVRQPLLILKQNELFRSHALGSFKTLTHAIVQDPAMMIYLDLQNSKKDKPNENFAREVFELFTLGEGHYTEQDIREAARAFTGYQLNRLTGKTFHVERQADTGAKTIFGKTGKFNGSDVVDLIFEQSETPRFMVRKIWEFFVYEKPSETAVNALAAIFRDADFKIEPLLREMFLSREFYSEKAIRTQIKSPIQYLVQLLKQLEISEPPIGFPINAQQQLGQILFLPPNVAGWDWGKAWINTNTLLARYNLAGVLTKGSEEAAIAMKGAQIRMPGNNRGGNGRGWSGPDYETLVPRESRVDPAKLVDDLIFRFFNGKLPDKARQSFIDYANAKKGAVFTNKEIGELCHLILSTPYYQLC